MNAFVLSFILFVSTVLSADPDVQTYCQQWFPNDNDCITNVMVSQEFFPNIMFLQNKKPMYPELCNSYYMTWSKDNYERDMTMISSITPPFGGQGAAYGPDDFTNCAPVSSVNRDYPLLETPLSNSVSRFVHYNIDGLLNLMQIRYSQRNPYFSIHFSRKQLIDALGETASPISIVNYLKDEGVCSEAEYDNAKKDNSNTPVCRRYKVESFQRLRPTSTCALANLVMQKDLFVQVALNPYYTQLYSAGYTDAPISKAYYSASFAGVVTGFNYAVTRPYFNLYITRHGGDGNRVHVKMSTAQPFANINMAVYDLQVAEVELSPEEITCNGKTVAQYIAEDGVMTIPDDCFNHPSITTLDLTTRFPDLLKINVGKRSFRYVRHFRAVNMDKLDLINLDEDSFTLTDRLDGAGNNRVDQNNNRQRAMEEGRTFEVSNCKKLRAIVLKKGAMADYIHFNVTDLTKLEAMRLGEANKSGLPGDCSWSFFHADRMYFDGFPKLTTLVIGNRVGYKSKDTKLTNMKELSAVYMGTWALYGEKPNTVVTLTNLKKLQTFTAFNAMTYATDLYVKDISWAKNLDMFKLEHSGNGLGVDQNGRYIQRTFGTLKTMHKGNDVPNSFVSAVAEATKSVDYNVVSW